MVGGGVIDWGGLGVVDRGGVIGSGGGGVVGSRLGGMIRGGLGVIGGGVGGGLGVVGLVVGGALVLDVSDVAVLVVGVVGHDLGAAVGEGNAVLAGDDTVVILNLVLAEVSSRVFVVDAILIGEGPEKSLHWRLIFLDIPEKCEAFRMKYMRADLTSKHLILNGISDCPDKWFSFVPSQVFTPSFP